MSTAIKINKFLNDFLDQVPKDSDKELYRSVKNEFIRQQNHIELIASENGCEHVDLSESCLAIERAKKLFNCKFANVQPHSGAQANGAVYLALIKPGDTILGMSLNSRTSYSWS